MWNLLIHLPRVRPELRFTIFVRRARDIESVRIQLHELSPTLDTICDIRTLAELPEWDVDVMWYPWNWVRRASRRAPMVATVHDIAPMLQLDHRWWKIGKRFKHRRRYGSTIRHADLIMTISGFTARELRDKFGVPDSKLRVTLLAADDLSAPESANRPGDIQHSAALAELGIDGPFFLTVGAHDGRKNLATLYHAMETLVSAGCVVPLVQCGPGLSRSKQKSAPPWLKTAGYVSDSELAVLYRRAIALVFPSRYEGFGLPIAEAMMAGGCVICANSSSLPEVAGDAALLFEWNDVYGLAKQMRRLLEEPDLRRELAERGRRQAATFTWRRNAEETLQTFDEAFAMRGDA